MVTALGGRTCDCKYRFLVLALARGAAHGAIPPCARTPNKVFTLFVLAGFAASRGTQLLKLSSVPSGCQPCGGAGPRGGLRGAHQGCVPRLPAVGAGLGSAPPTVDGTSSGSSRYPRGTSASCGRVLRGSLVYTDGAAPAHHDYAGPGEPDTSSSPTRGVTATSGACLVPCTTYRKTANPIETHFWPNFARGVPKSTKKVEDVLASF